MNFINFAKRMTYRRGPLLALLAGSLTLSGLQAQAAPESPPPTEEASTSTADEETTATDDAATVDDEYTPTFSGTSLIHFPSTQTLEAGTLEATFYHRFGNASRSFDDFLGLDNGATVMLSADYALTDSLSLGIGRATAYKTWELRGRYSLLQQADDWPVSLVVLGAFDQETQDKVLNLGPVISPARLTSTGVPALDSVIQRWNQREYELTLDDKRDYSGALLISRRITPWFSVQLAPAFTHRNFVPTRLRNDRFGLSVGGLLRISERVGIVFESVFTSHRDYEGDDYRTVDLQSYGNLTQYTADEINVLLARDRTQLVPIFVRNVLLDKPVPHRFTPFSVGIDLDTGGHLFQFFVTNSRATFAGELLRGADFDYRDGDFTLGFNISRKFYFGDDT